VASIGRTWRSSQRRLCVAHGVASAYTRSKFSYHAQYPGRAEPPSGHGVPARQPHGRGVTKSAISTFDTRLRAHSSDNRASAPIRDGLATIGETPAMARLSGETAIGVATQRRHEHGRPAAATRSRRRRVYSEWAGFRDTNPVPRGRHSDRRAKCRETLFHPGAPGDGTLGCSAQSRILPQFSPTVVRCVHS